LNSLADYTSLELLLPKLQSRDSAQALKELCGRLEYAGKVPNSALFYNAVMAREKLSSTATSPGWAMPHSRIQGLSELSFALGMSPEPMEWLGNSAVPVSMIFLFAVPETEIGSYLRVISGLARLNRKPALLSELLRVVDSQAMLELLRQISVGEVRPPVLKG